ncbi:MAG: Restriction endonuclease BglII [Gammaproteobacteria bacterium]|jgi:hypothetical protein|nr:Restriction endonuclease BglII [Gammaproteobacteria bacterium]
MMMKEKEENQADVDLSPNSNADTNKEIAQYINPQIMSLYEVFSYRHAAAILKNSFPKELNEIENALLNFKITINNIAAPGGSESDIPKKLSLQLRPNGWYETRIQGDLLIRVIEQHEKIHPADKSKKNLL